MLNFILFDDYAWQNLLPLTFTRPVCEIRIGILTITEKWKKNLNAEVSFLTQDYLSEKYSLHLSDDNIWINGSIIPTPELVKEICELKSGTCLRSGQITIACRSGREPRPFQQSVVDSFSVTECNLPFLKIDRPWQIFEKNGIALETDYRLLTSGRSSQVISSTNQVAGREQIFIEEGARVEFSILNAQTGPIYIGKDSLVMEGAIIRGPFSLGEGAVVKMGAKIYGPTTIGPYSKVGGEITNSVVFGNSNKGHEGYLGNSVLGEWCNLGADTNNSNLKNNYEKVRLWSYPEGRFINTELQFCGLIMGDHSKSGINTMFNTGTVVGVSSNIYGAGFPRNFVPSFAWGGPQGYITYLPEKAIKTAELVLSRRNLVMDETDKKILRHIFAITDKYRKF